MLEKSLKLLETMVNIDSGTGDREGLGKLAAIIQGETKRLGCRFQVFTARDGSEHYYISCGSGQKVLFIAHLDTVFAKGASARRPFTINGNKAFGPGVSDCKSGVVTILAALEQVGEISSGFEIGCLFNTDEEIGSPGSREIIMQLADSATAVLVVEPAEGDNLTVARKGIGRFDLRVSGRAAHSGSNYQDGRSAILELAHKITAIHDLSDLQTGITFNVGVIHGGTRPNIIADWAEAEIDLRIKTAAQEQEALAQLNMVASQSWIQGTTSRLEGGITRPPLEPTPGNLSLFHSFQEIGRGLGLELGALESGGGSDANLVAQLGVPVLDGLGPVGGGHHSEEEYLYVPSLYPRIQLLAGFLKALAK